MNIFDLLIAYFAGAIAFAGFMGIVSQIDRKAVLASPRAISFRIRVLATCSLILMFLSIFPFLEFGFSVTGPLAWQIGCAVAATIIIVNFLVILMLTRRLNDTRTAEARPLNRFLIWANNVLGVVVAAIAAGGAGGWLPSEGAYLAAASFYLWIVATTFLQIVLMLDDIIRERS